MRFRCPSCGFSGQVRVPASFPRGRSARVRCARCRNTFTLAVGRLWPQDTAEAYEALVPGALGCAGEKVGRLWVEITGARKGTPPLIALQPHPSFSHEVLHDLLDPFREHFPVVYLEFPGSRWNPDEPERGALVPAVRDSLDLLKVKLKAPRFHLLGHLDSCRLALRIASSRPQEVFSLILLEPLLRGFPRQELPWELASGQELSEEAAAATVQRLLVRHWSLSPEDPHVAGLAGLLSGGLSPALFRRSETALQHPGGYARLSRLRTPALIFSARDGTPAARADALYLCSTLPGAELAPLERGGAMAAWSGGTWFVSKLLAFKQGAERAAEERLHRRSQTAAGQPLGWLTALFTALTWGLQALLARYSPQPEHLRSVLPVLFGSLLPVLWFLVPRGLNPLVLLRFRAFKGRTVLLPLLIGGFLGTAFFSLLASGAVPGSAWPPPPGLAALSPSWAAALPLGHPGRLYAAAALLAGAAFSFGLVQNLALMRRLRGGLLLALLLFALVPLSWPDLLWTLPAAAAGALLFAHDLSVFAPLAVVAGAFFGAELPAAYLRNASPLAGAPGWVLALLLLIGAAFLTALELTWNKGFRAEDLYPAGTYRWRPAVGVPLVLLSLAAAAGTLFAVVR